MGKIPPKKLLLSQSTTKSNPKKRTKLKKHKLRSSKSVAFAMDDNDHNIPKSDHDKIAPLPSKSTSRKKTKLRKRKSITPGDTIKKQLQKHLGSVNNYLLPV